MCNTRHVSLVGRLSNSVALVVVWGQNIVQPTCANVTNVSCYVIQNVTTLLYAKINNAVFILFSISLTT